MSQLMELLGAFLVIAFAVWLIGVILLAGLWCDPDLDGPEATFCVVFWPIAGFITFWRRK